jgi:hypothetical protein
LRHPNRGACISREAENAEFNTDENRDAILNPTAGWEIYHGARMLPVIGIEYSFGTSSPCSYQLMPYADQTQGKEMSKWIGDLCDPQVISV